MSQSETSAEADCPGIAIVGGGCSGLLVAVQLLKLRYRGRITIIEPKSKLGRGLAYSTQFDEHLLNIPAGKMSALCDAPDHFLRWLKTHGFAGATAATFAPRRVYGEYLEDVLNVETRAGDGGCVHHICTEVSDIAADGGGVHLTLSDGSTLRAERVVLALGNPASCQHPGPWAQSLDGRWQPSPWIGDALRVRFAGERILLLGMGLTAVDSVMALQSQALPCQIYMISRRGIQPQVHNLPLSTSMPPIFEECGSLRTMFRELRAQIEVMGEEDLCWRAAIDSLRPVSNDMWRGLSVGDQKRFLRHLKTYWEAHRHRMAPEIRQRMDQYRAEGKVHAIAGRLRDTSTHGTAIQARIALRRGGEQLLEVDRIVSCTGIQENYRESPRGLIRRLIDKGLASANDMGTGFRADRHGALIDAEMHASSTLFTLGPPRLGEVFETTAVPEIRAQAKELADHLTHAALQ
ncbi:MAG: FAD/NAD(P)-binding protein [Bryobacteraceae bacterium]|jgi:uncharacterized NAD(P)/FAD-binding protein YdhS